MAFNDYAARIDSFDPSDAEAFRNLLLELLGDLDMPAIDLCEEFDVSVATVTRWIDGRSAPAEQLRPLVLKRLAGHIAAPKYAVAS